MVKMNIVQLDATIDLDKVLETATKTDAGVTMAEHLMVRIVVRYAGVDIVCKSDDEARAFCREVVADFTGCAARD